MQQPPKLIDVPRADSVVRPERIETTGRTLSAPPIHPLAAILLIVVDSLWNFAEWTVVSWVLTIPLSFMSVFIPTLIIQKLLKRDTFGRALGFALLLGVVAAVPTSVTGTPVGLTLLAWTGISKLLGPTLRR